MKNLRRIKRMTRAKRNKPPALNLVSMMDIFTILVFFLLVNQSNTEELPSPDIIKLPDSISEEKPEQTIVLLVMPDQILMNGEIIISASEAVAGEVAVHRLVTPARPGTLAVGEVLQHRRHRALAGARGQPQARRQPRPVRHRDPGVLDLAHLVRQARHRSRHGGSLAARVRSRRAQAQGPPSAAAGLGALPKSPSAAAAR